jgi:hypothetical protein
MYTQFLEPWRVAEEEQAGEILNAAGLVIVDPMGSTLDIADEASYMRRIVACVNACAGVPTEDLERVAGFTRDHLRQGKTIVPQPSGSVQ